MKHIRKFFGWRSLYLFLAFVFLITQTAYSLAPQSHWNDKKNPKLRRWLKEHPKLVQTCGYAVWQEIYETYSPVEAMEILDNMMRDYLATNVIRDAGDARRLASAYDRLAPYLWGRTDAFLALNYSILREAFADDFVSCWGPSLDLAAAAARIVPIEMAEKRASGVVWELWELKKNWNISSEIVRDLDIATLHGLAVMRSYCGWKPAGPKELHGAIAELKSLAGKENATDASLFWLMRYRTSFSPAVGDMPKTESLDENFQKLVVLIKDGTIVSAADLKVLRVGLKKGLTTPFLHAFWPQVKRCSGERGFEDAQWADAFINQITPSVMTRLMPLLTEWNWSFRSMQDIEDTIAEMAGHKDSDKTPLTAILWFLASQWGYMQSNEKDTQEILDILAPGKDTEVDANTVRLIGRLRHAAVKDIEDLKRVVKKDVKVCPDDKALLTQLLPNTDASDWALLDVAMEKLGPMFGDGVVSFLAKFYPRFQKHYGPELPSVWPELLSLLTVGSRQDARDLAVALLASKVAPTAKILDLTKQYYPDLKKDFGEELPQHLADILNIFAGPDAALLGPAMSQLHPYMGNQVIPFLLTCFPAFQKAFGEELPKIWADIPALLMSAHSYDWNKNLQSAQAIADCLLRLKSSFGPNFRLSWPVIRFVGEEAEENAVLVLSTLDDLHYRHSIDNAMMLGDLGKALLRVAGQDKKYFHLFSDKMFPAILSLAPKDWQTNWSSWEKIQTVIKLIDYQTMQLLEPLLELWYWPFEGLEDMEKTIDGLQTLTDKHEPGSVPILWFLQTRLGNIAKGKAGVKRLWDHLTEPAPPKRGEVALLSMLRFVRMKNVQDYISALKTARIHLKASGAEAIHAAQAQLMLTDQMEPNDFHALYPLMLEHRIAITDEVLSEWHKIVSSGMPESEAIATMGKRYPDKISDTIHVPAVMHMVTPDQAKHVAEVLAKDGKQPFIRIGRLVGLDGKVLMKETALARNIANNSSRWIICSWFPCAIRWPSVGPQSISGLR